MGFKASNTTAIQKEEIQRKTAAAIANLANATLADRKTVASLSETVTKLSIELSESNAKIMAALTNCNQSHIENVSLRSGGGGDNTG